jgi:serine/threonine protein kinase
VLPYRDLKPANVGFTLAGEVKLYDFGLAREVVDDGRKMTGYTGSARYMAPEGTCTHALTGKVARQEDVDHMCSHLLYVPFLFSCTQ